MSKESKTRSVPNDWQELREARPNWQIDPPADLLAGKVILITGAGDGIGRVAAKTFAHYGANVVLLGRTREKLEAVFDEITVATSTQPVIVPADLRFLADDNAMALADSIQDAFGHLDGLLHNASVLGSMLPIAHYPKTTWEEVFQVNVHAQVLLTRHLQPLLDLSPAASVVFTSSGVGREGRAYWGAYSASKFATEGIMQILADETETAGRIKVNSVNPGGTRTPMRAAAYPAEDPATLPIAEAHMDLYLYLFSHLGRSHHGEALDAKNWAPA